MDKICGIYRIVHTASQRAYVGQSVDINRRWSRHRYMLNSNTHHSPYLQHLWTKYGEEAFAWETVEECSPEVLVTREQYWMDTTLHTLNCAPAAGSTRGVHPSEKTREKISAANRRRVLSEKTREKIGVANMGHTRNVGHVHTAETRAKISAALVNNRYGVGNKDRAGHVHTAETRAKIGAASRGRVASTETRSRLSAASMGNKNGAGHVHTAETRALMSQARKGRKQTPEHVANVRAAKIAKTAYRSSSEGVVLGAGIEPTTSGV